MNYRVLTQQQLEEVRRKWQHEHQTIRNLKQYLLNEHNVEISISTLWENLTGIRRDRKIYLRVYFKQRQKPVCIPCSKCEICLTRDIKDKCIPVNYRIGDTCISCYMESIGLKYLDLVEHE